MKTLIRALLGASMLMPVAAQAQRAGFDAESKIAVQADQPDPAPRPSRVAEGPRQHQADREGGDRQRARADGGDVQPTGGSQRPDGAGFRADRHDDRQAIDGSRQDYRRERQDQRAGVAGTATATGGYRGDARPVRQDDRQQYRQDQGDDRRYPGHNWGQNSGQDWSRDHNQPHRDDGWRGPDRARSERDGPVTIHRGNGNDRGWVDDRRGASWSRNWRTDNRYDWNRYRAGNRSAYRLPRYYAPYGWSYGYRRFSIGVTLASVLWAQDYWIDDPWDYRLPQAYGPYRWVRYYNDALLIDIRNGRVVDVVNDIFW